MALTKIRATQIQAASGNVGIDDLHIKDNAGIQQSKIAGLTEALAGQTTAVEAEVTRATAAEAALQTAITQEVTDRQAAISQLSSDVNNIVAPAIEAEETRALAAEAALQTAINNEVTRAQGAETTLQGNIDAANTAISTEVTNRTAAVTGVQSNLDAEVLRATGKEAELQAAINAANASAEAAIAGLDPKLSVLVAATSNIVLSGLQVIDGQVLPAGARVLAAGQTDKRENGIYVAADGAWSRAADADNTPGAEFTSCLYTFVEKGTYQGYGYVCVTGNSTTIAGVPAINLGVDEIVFTQFTAVGAYSAGTGITIAGQIIKLTNTGIVAGSYTKLTINEQGQAVAGENPTTLAGYGITDAALQADLVAEAAAARAAEGTLTTNLNAEITRAQGAETTLQGNIDAANTAVAAEVTRATAAEDTLTTNLAAEVTRAQAAEATLQSNIDAAGSTGTAAVEAEATRATAAEAALAADLAAEVARATAAEAARYTKTEVDDKFTAIVDAAPEAFNTLGKIAAELANDDSIAAGIVTSISNEVTRAQAAEDTLTTNLAAEVTRATAAETTLTTNLAAEVTRATGAEDTLTTNLAAEVTRATAAETTLTTNLSAEVTRATGAEAGIQGQIDAIKAGTTEVVTVSRIVLRDPVSGVCDGVNNVFILSKACVPNTEQVMYNGQELYPGVSDDYTIGADFRTITLNFVPAATDRVSINFVAA